MDDDSVFRRLARWQLERLGFEPVTVATGEDAVARAADADFAAILMDLHLPGIDGYEAARRIRAGSRNARVPIIAVSVDADEDKVAAAGMNASLAKPVQVAQLEQTLGGQLGGLPPAAAAARKARRDAFASEVRSAFVADAPNRCAELRGARAAGDALAIVRLAHSLVGTARQAGFGDLADSARAVEDLAKAGYLSPDATRRLDGLIAALEEIR